MSKRPTGLHCPSCGHTTLQGLTRTEEAIVAKLTASAVALSADEVLRGLYVDAGSLRVLVSRLRKKMEPHGWTISRGKKGIGAKATYRLEAMTETA